MKAFLRTLFFLDNPRLGVFVMATLVMAVHCLILPSALYVLFLMPSDVITMQGATRCIYIGRYIQLLFGVYGFILMFNCVGLLLRETFSPRPKHPFVRTLIGTLGVPLTFLICAVRQKRLAAGVAAGVALAIQMLSIAVILGRWPGYVLGMWAFAGTIAALAALYLLRFGKPVNAAWLAAYCLLPLALCAQLHWFAGVSRDGAACAEARYLHTTGLNMTFDDFKACYTNGVPFSSEPYATLFSPDNEFEGMDEDILFCFLEPRRLRPDALDFFDAFTESNKTYLTMVDAVTENPLPKLAHDATEDLASHPELSVLMRWADYYVSRLVVAAERGDTAALLRTSQRLEHIRDALWQFQSLIGTYGGAEVGRRRVAALAHSLELAPDDLFPRLQAELAAHPEKIRARLNLNYLLEFYDATDLLINFEDGAVHTWRKRASLLFYLIWDIWRYQEMQAYGATYNDCVSILLDPTLSGEERETRCRHVRDKQKKQSRLVLSSCMTDFLYDLKPLPDAESFADVCVAGLAVERYRRKYKRLPETLDDLAPEFLDKPPRSSYDNTPLKYEHGVLEQDGWLDDETITIPFYGYRVSTEESNFTVPLFNSAPAAMPQ